MNMLVISACTVFVITWMGIAMTNEIYVFDFLNNMDLRVILLCVAMFLLQFPLLLRFKSRKQDCCDVFCVGLMIVFGIFVLLRSSFTVLPQFKLEMVFVFSIILVIEAIASVIYIKKYELD